LPCRSIYRFFIEKKYVVTFPSPLKPLMGAAFSIVVSVVVFIFAFFIASEKCVCYFSRAVEVRRFTPRPRTDRKIKITDSMELEQ